MRLSPRFGAFLFLLLYSAFTVAGCLAMRWAHCEFRHLLRATQFLGETRWAHVHEGDALFIWSLEQTDTTWRLIWIGLVVSGFVWSLREDLTLDQLSPRRGGARRQP